MPLLLSIHVQVPARSFEVVAQTIAEETGRPVHETFSEFDPTPLGSASIGQVHRARLKNTGQEVAVKVQYPEVQVNTRHRASERASERGAGRARAREK